MSRVFAILLAVLCCGASSIESQARGVAAPIDEAALKAFDGPPSADFASLPTPEAPDPSAGWIFAAGFLALVVVRRTRAPTLL